MPPLVGKFRCKKCGAIGDVKVYWPDDNIDMLADPMKFKGSCPSCKAKIRGKVVDTAKQVAKWKASQN